MKGLAEALSKYAKGSNSESSADEDEGDEYTEAVSDFMAAVKSGDKSKAADALRAAVHACMMDEDDEDGAGLTISVL
jgi:hypothetical protein